MAESTRHLIRHGLDRAVAAAFEALGARIHSLPPEARAQAQRCAEEIHACLGDLADSPGAAPGIQASLERLIFSHADPDLCAALREFAEILVVHLKEESRRLKPGPNERMDS